MKPNPKTLKNLEIQQEFQTSQSVKGNILALDYGEKFCGLAYHQHGVSLPLGVFARDEIYEVVKQEIKTKNIQRLVIGLPLSSNGSENNICTQIRALAASFDKFVPVEFINERFSTQNIITKDKKSRIDDLAALQILEFYLHKK